MMVHHAAARFVALGQQSIYMRCPTTLTFHRHCIVRVNFLHRPLCLSSLVTAFRYGTLLKRHNGVKAASRVVLAVLREVIPW